MAESDSEISNIVEQVVSDAILEVERSLLENDHHENLSVSVLTNSPEYAPTMLLSPTLSHVTNPDVTVDPMDYELSVASAISSEKTRNKHYNAWLDKYLAANGGNLYPSRDEKNRLAAEMNISVDRVTRFFANRRRKQSKNKPKKGGQASPVTIMATSGGLQQIVNEASAVSPQIVDFTQATPAQQIGGEEKEAEKTFLEKIMVALSNNVQQMVASQELAQLALFFAQPQQQQQSAENPQNQAEQEAKLLAFQQPNVQLLMIFLQQQLQSGANINLGSAVQQVQTYLLHQQLSQVQAQVQQQAAQFQQQQKELQQQQQWGGSSISASPIINSDSEISEQSELSPRAYLQMLEQQQKAADVTPNDLDRMRSPPFKDPHQLADPEMTKLLDAPSTSTDVFQFADNSASSLAYSRLSEREKLAVAALTEFGNRSYIR
ncbi:unnamed protein product [Caenorhabditis angaria]|uniref:Homeobox domain-containing protein n=1 Tax=Caenorhabditis angaria TaxID=860376 RepID=A0A9P1I2W9_9PELO|nr:unnamed protein product [Caenorhabditis angaria]